MLPWKINQKIYSALAEKKDLLGIHISQDKIRTVKGDLIAAINRQFYDCENIWIPAKSYCVALVYANELTKDYGGQIVTYLNDPELLPQDQYFCCYQDSPIVYDWFLVNTHWHSSPMTELIKKHYCKEIHLEGFEQCTQTL